MSHSKLPFAKQQPLGATIWLTGFSGAGKTTIGSAVADFLDDRDIATQMIDADLLRDGLNAGLGFSREDRSENVRRLGEVALLFAQSGAISIVATISPYRDDRERVRDRHHANGIPFFEVYVSTPLDVCEGRDPKGLYARARCGQLAQFTGISDVYEIPENPDLVLMTHTDPLEINVKQVVQLVNQPASVVAQVV